ncbi:MAG: RNA-binding protein [Alphaproteobacteria bacterium]|jgi:predicted RNA-binding protein YlxR (DUF448 family)
MQKVKTLKPKLKQPGKTDLGIMDVRGTKNKTPLTLAGKAGHKGKSEESLRRCLVSGETASRDAMIRFVPGPDFGSKHGVVVDLDERLPGRGLWIMARHDVLAEAASGRHFSRVLGAPVEISPDLTEQVESGLVSRVGSLIGMARRAGRAMAGFEKVRGALKSGEVRILLAASDGAADGRAKLRALAGDTPIAVALDASELGKIFGRDGTVHGAITDVRLAKRIRRESARLAGLRPGLETELGTELRPELHNESKNTGILDVPEVLVKDRVDKA